MNLLFYQAGPFHGLETTLRCAKEHSGCKVILIGDQDSSIPDEAIKVDTRSGIASEFRDAYRHVSDADWEWQFQTILRWIVIADVCKQQRLTPFWYVDSDFLVFGDLTKRPMLGDVGCIQQLSVGTSYWINGPTINLFAQFIQDFYRKWDHGISEGARICDMTIFTEFLKCYRSALCVDELTSVYNQTTFDNNPTTDLDIYSNDGQYKKYEFVNGVPRVALRNGGGFVNFNTIHCWWTFKARIDELYAASKASRT